MKKIFSIYLFVWIFAFTLTAQSSPHDQFTNMKSNLHFGVEQIDNQTSNSPIGTGSCDIMMPPEFENIIQIGGDGRNRGMCMVTNSNNDLFVAGYYHDEIEFFPGTTLTSIGLSDLFLAKYNSAGNLLWIKSANAGATGRAIPYAITLDGNGDVLLTGGYTGNYLNFDGNHLSAALEERLFVCKYNQDGTYQWANNSGTTSFSRGVDVEVNSMGTIWVIESSGIFFNKPSQLVSYNPNGSLNTTWDNGTKITDIHFANGKIYMTGLLTNQAFFGSFSLAGPTVYSNLFIAIANEDLSTFMFADEATTTTSSADSRGVKITTIGMDAYLIGEYRGEIIMQGNTFPNGQNSLALIGFDEFGNISTTNVSVDSRISNHQIFSDGNELYLSGNILDKLDFNGVPIQTYTDATGFVAKFNTSSGLAQSVNAIESTSNNKFEISNVSLWNSGFMTTGRYAHNYFLNHQDALFTPQTTNIVQSEAGWIGSSYISKPVLDKDNYIYVANRYLGTSKINNQTSSQSNTPSLKLSKLTTAGNVIWSKEIVGDSERPLLSTGNLELSNDGSRLFMITQFTGSVTIDNNSPINASSTNAILITSWDLNGNLQWATTIDCDGYTDSHSDLAQAPNGELYVSGIYDELIKIGSDTYNSTSYDVFLAKLDASGNFLWSKSMGGNSIEYNSKLQTNSQGDLYVAGEFLSDVFTIDGVNYPINDGDGNVVIIKFDNNGTFQWLNSYGGGISDPNLDDYCWPTGFKIDNNDNLLLSGWTGYANQYGSYPLVSQRHNPNSNRYYFNWFTAKLDGNGNVLWANMIEKGRFDQLSYESHETDQYGNSYILGRFNDSIFIDGISIVPDGERDLITLKYDENGVFEWAKKVGGNNVVPSGLAVGDEDQLVIHFSNGNETDFCTESRLTSSRNAFLGILGMLNTSNETPDTPANDLTVFPNPGSDVVTINGTIEESATLHFELYDVTGKQISKYSSEQYPKGYFSKTINIKELTPGTYFIHLVVNGQSQWEKVIKM